jgi:hypothetical protein
MPVEVIDGTTFISLVYSRPTAELVISFNHLKEGAVHLLDESFGTLLNFLTLLEVQGGPGASDAPNQNHNKAAHMLRYLRLI